MVALEEIHTFLVGYIGENPWVQAAVEPKPFDHYRDKFLKVLQYYGTKEEKHSQWLDLIHNNYFEFADHDTIDRNLNYDPREWFREAVEVISIAFWKKCLSGLINNCDFYRSKPNFATSRWARFMHAAAEHQFIVLNKILPTETLYLNALPSVLP